MRLFILHVNLSLFLIEFGTVFGGCSHLRIQRDRAVTLVMMKVQRFSAPPPGALLLIAHTPGCRSPRVPRELTAFLALFFLFHEMKKSDITLTYKQPHEWRSVNNLNRCHGSRLFMAAQTTFILLVEIKEMVLLLS